MTKIYDPSETTKIYDAIRVLDSHGDDNGVHPVTDFATLIPRVDGDELAGVCKESAAADAAANPTDVKKVLNQPPHYPAGNIQAPSIDGAVPVAPAYPPVQTAVRPMATAYPVKSVYLSNPTTDALLVKCHDPVKISNPTTDAQFRQFYRQATVSMSSTGKGGGKTTGNKSRVTSTKSKLGGGLTKATSTKAKSAEYKSAKGNFFNFHTNHTTIHIQPEEGHENPLRVWPGINSTIRSPRHRSVLEKVRNRAQPDQGQTSCHVSRHSPQLLFNNVSGPKPHLLSFFLSLEANAHFLQIIY